MTSSSQTKVSICRGCGNALGPWNERKRSMTGKMIPQNPDGTNHECPARKQYQQQAQPQQQQQSPQQQTVNLTEIVSTISSSVQEIRNEIVKTTDGIHRLANEYEHISRELVRLNDYYDGLVTAQKGTAAILSQYLDKNQRMADAEAQYDQDKEDGLV